MMTFVFCSTCYLFDGGKLFAMSIISIVVVIVTWPSGSVGGLGPRGRTQGRAPQQQRPSGRT
jgi:hypothetical protein